MPRNPAKNKHNQPEWWDKRLKKAGFAKHRGERPRHESHVGGSNQLEMIESKNARDNHARADAPPVLPSAGKRITLEA